jgi:hypothetical protein
MYRLFEAEVREEENRTCCQVYWVLWYISHTRCTHGSLFAHYRRGLLECRTVFILVAIAVALGLTVFRSQLEPHYRQILELGYIPFVSTRRMLCASMGQSAVDQSICSSPIVGECR